MARGIWTALLLIAVAAPAGAAVRHVGPGQPYATVQAGVDAAAAGDVVLVHDGTYAEHVVVARRVTLRSLDWELHGENDGAVIDAGGSEGHGILVRADGVVVEGFSLTGAAGHADFGLHAGIAVDGAQGCRIVGNRCGWDETHRNDAGMSFRAADDLVVEDNEVGFGELGFYIQDCSGGAWRGNDVHDHRGLGDSGGFRLVGSAEKDASTAERNLIAGNRSAYNEIGVHLEIGATRNVIRDNEVVGNWVGILVEDGSSENVIANNVLADNPSRAIQINESHFNTVVHNACTNSETGIRLGARPPFDEGSDGNTIAFNTIAGSTALGLLASPLADRNEVFLNEFRDNARHVDARGQTAWQPPVALSYFLDGANHSVALGNRYDTYDGDDLDGDGVGDTGLPFRDGGAANGPEEYHPLVRPPADVALQAWSLQAGSSPVLAHDDLAGGVGVVTVPPLEPVVWETAQPAAVDLTFPAGTWRGRLRFASPPAAGLALELGIRAAPGAFTPFAPPVTVSEGEWESVVAIDASAVTVRAGERLAVRLTGGDGAASLVWAGGAASLVTSPGNGDPPWREQPASVDTPPPAGAVLRSWPNPFNPRAEIAFDLPREGRVQLALHDLAGRRVRTLIAGDTLPAGRQATFWDGRDDHGRPLASGTYVARLLAPGVTVTLPLTLVR